MNAMKNNQGFTFIEIIIVIAIMAVLAVMILPSLSRFRNEQALKNATADIVSLLNKAKSDADSLTLSTDYSVHFESGRAVYFIGTSFTEPNSNNRELTLDSAVTIPSSGGINLNGGGSNVTFTRLTGDDRGYVTGYGTIIVQLTSDSSRQKIITINKTGAVSVN
jgi:prepilin-type N-terminal cleavage/methylation domain-containing protein